MCAASVELALAADKVGGAEALGVTVATGAALVWLPAGLWFLAGAGAALAFAVKWLRVGPWMLAAGGAAVAVASYAHLVSYSRFVGYAPFAAAWALWGAYLFLGARWLLLSPSRWRLAVVIAVGLAAATTTSWMVKSNLDSRYPTLLAASFQVRLFSLHLAFGAAVSLLQLSTRKRVGLSVIGTSMVGLLVLVGSNLPDNHRMRGILRETTSVGIVEATRRRVVEPCIRKPAPLDEQEAAREFAENSGLPALPGDFHLDDYNLLLVTVEALRADHTSLMGSDLTPNLQRFIEQGAFAFDRAYAPSSRTWLSVASLFSMRPVSQAPIITRSPIWMGSLLAEADTAAEHLAAAGYVTVALRHDFQGTSGLEQGFSRVHLEMGQVTPRHGVDRNLAGRTIDVIAEHAAVRHFVWTFFASPHDPYIGDASLSVPVRYRAAVRHFDQQLGRVLTYLERTGALRTTVVIVTADHGEELSDESGVHGISVSSESIRVPLVVWLPGVQGDVSSDPTSLTYLFPWLLSSARADGLRAAARSVIREQLAASMRASDGAVVAEIVDNNAEQVALAWRSIKLDHNYRSGLTRVYRTGDDFEDGDDRSGESAHDVKRAMDAWVAYRQARACSRLVQVLSEEVEVSFRGGSWREYHSVHE